MPDGERMVDREAVPTESTLLVTVRERDTDEEQEVLLIDGGDGVEAWFNYCQHWRDVRLDKGEGALVRNDEIVCQKHAATFESDSGYCNFGPCEGAVLDSLDVRTDADAVYLADDGYTFVRVGPSEGDDDPACGSRIDF
jgi:nitrite reductase/ring-hydroxylating ferredoxin subunit